MGGFSAKARKKTLRKEPLESFNIREGLKERQIGQHQITRLIQYMRDILRNVPAFLIACSVPEKTNFKKFLPFVETSGKTFNHFACRFNLFLPNYTIYFAKLFPEIS